jgi:membrane protease YdiL (CAAX protease family)
VGEPFADAMVLPLVMTVTGIGLAWIYERRQSLLAPIAAHMVFNAIGLVLILSGAGA